jgi:hypothetical protein
MNDKIEPQTTNQEEQSTDGKTKYPSWSEFSANGGTFLDYLNGKLESKGLPTFVASKTDDTEQTTLREKRTMRFVPHSSQQSSHNSTPERKQ